MIQRAKLAQTARIPLDPLYPPTGAFPKGEAPSIPAVNRHMSPWKILTASPHRLLFFFGGLQSVLTILWWLLVQLARLEVIPPVHPLLPPGAAHAWLMLYGLFPFFVFGFLFTALPNWVEGGRISRRAYLVTALPMALGATLFYPALYYPTLAFAALPPYLAGWITGLIALLRLLRAGPSRDKRQPWLARASLVPGLAGAALFTLWLALGEEVWLRASLALALWGFLNPLFLAVCHRMVPPGGSRLLRFA